MDCKLYRIVSQVFGVSLEEVTDASDTESIPGWDSMSHVHLILSLEADYGLTLSPEEAMEMMSVRQIREILAERGVTRAT